jgi:hypothetical protein
VPVPTTCTVLFGVASRARSITTMLVMEFIRMLALRQLALDGSGSTAITNPLGPTRCDACKEKHPILAPASRTMSPGAILESRKSYSRARKTCENAALSPSEPSVPGSRRLTRTPAVPTITSLVLHLSERFAVQPRNRPVASRTTVQRRWRMLPRVLRWHAKLSLKT